MRYALLASALLLSACASHPQGITLDRFRGVYSSHFDGIPDRSGICAVLQNHGSRDASWVRLTMQAFGAKGDRASRWTSHWLYAHPLRSGESVAVAFENAPHADQIDLRIDRVGRGAHLPRVGRPLLRSRTCNEGELRAALREAARGRQAQGVQLIPIVRRNDPEGLED